MSPEELRNWAGYQTNRIMVIEKLLEHVDAQDKQIAALKATLITERLLALDRNLGNVAFRKSMAASQLARELPVVDWNE